MKKRLTSELGKLKGNFVALTILPKDNYQELNMHILSILMDRHEKGAYVAINKPYDTIISSMKKNKLDHKNLFFVDCVSENNKKEENCIFLSSPESITNICVALEDAYNLNKHSFIFLDSIDALSLYHNPNIIIRFVRSLVQQIRQKNMSGLMIGLHEETDKKIIDEISIVCDKVINLGKTIK